MKPLVTIPDKLQIIGSLCEPKFHGHFRPQTNQYMIYFTNYTINNPHNAHTVTAFPFWFQKLTTTRFQDLRLIKRPLTASFNSNIHKVLKRRIKPIPRGVCRNSSNMVPTRRPLRVEQLSFSSQRLPTVGSLDILERSLTFSL